MVIWLRAFAAPALVCVFMSMAASPAPPPATAPISLARAPSTGRINLLGSTTVHLNDPVSKSAQCSLDLDTGQTFDFERYSDGSSIRAAGIDLMCETREPCNGVAIYDLVLVETTREFEDSWDYNAIPQQLSKEQPQPFELRTLKDALPKRYLFRTHDGAIGVIEFSRLTQAPSGLDLRYMLI